MTDYTKLVEALRCGTFGDDECGNSDCPYWSGLGCMDGIATEEAADAIEALQAQLPKLGEWVGVSPMVDTVQCSVCGGQLFSAELETPYCPYCGADMREMEVQE